MISVIVPVYNCENYLVDSIESLIAQSIFNQLEIIFIDDGSTDNSFSIISNYVKRFENMKCYMQSNKGVSSARNLGIIKSSGEYIAFFDADDLAINNLYEKLLFLIEKDNADLSCVNYSMLFQDGITKVHKSKRQVTLNNEESLLSFFNDDLICTNPVDKLFRAEIAKKISFPEGFSIGEDMYFVFKYLQLSRKIVIDTTESLYQYCIRENSAMQSKFGKKNFHSIELANKIKEELINIPSIFKYAEANYFHEICKMLSCFYKNINTEYLSEEKKYRQILSTYSILNAYKYFRLKHFLGYILMRISPKMYSIIYRILHIG